jgi:LysR family hydrogen peroxide-inducible transcriptional activator
VLLEIDDMIAGARQLREPRSGTFRMLDEGDCFRAQALSVCNRAGARETELRATSLSTLAQMVSSGSGITLLPQIAVAVENRRCQLDVRPFTSPAPHRTIAPPVVCDCIPLIWRPQSPFADTFHELAQVFRAALGRDRSPGARRPVTR